MKYDYIVVGAGISGLSASYHANIKGMNGLILEAKNQIGGCIETALVDDFKIELGAHSCFNSYSGLLEILAKLDSSPTLLSLEKLPFLLFEGEKPRPIIKAMNLPELIFSLFKILYLKKQDKTVQQYYGGLVGKANYKNVIAHALSAVSCQNVSDMPADFLFQKRRKNKQYPKKFSTTDGMSGIVSAFASELEIKTNSKISQIIKKPNGWQIKTATDNYQAEKLIMAIPAQNAAQLLQNSLPDLADALRQIKTTHFDSLAVLVNDKLETIKPNAGWVGVDTAIYSMVSADTANQPSNIRGFSFHFKPDSCSQTQQKQQVLRWLNITEDQVVNFFHKKNQLPKIDFNHQEKLNKIDLLTPKNLAICGNFFQGMAIEDCIQRAKSQINSLM